MHVLDAPATACCLLTTAYYLLPCLLPTAYCLLPTYLLPTAYLPTAYLPTYLLPTCECQPRHATAGCDTLALPRRRVLKILGLRHRVHILSQVLVGGPRLARDPWLWRASVPAAARLALRLVRARADLVPAADLVSRSRQVVARAGAAGTVAALLQVGQHARHVGRHRRGHCWLGRARRGCLRPAVQTRCQHGAGTGQGCTPGRTCFLPLELRRASKHNKSSGFRKCNYFARRHQKLALGNALSKRHQPTTRPFCCS